MSDCRQNGYKSYCITTRNFWRVVNHFLELAKKYYGVVFVEDGVITGGIGEYLNGLLAKNSFTNTRVLGFEDKYYSHGTREEILEESGLSSVHIEKAIKSCSK